MLPTTTNNLNPPYRFNGDQKRYPANVTQQTIREYEYADAMEECYRLSKSDNVRTYQLDDYYDSGDSWKYFVLAMDGYLVAAKGNYTAAQDRFFTLLKTEDGQRYLATVKYLNSNSNDERLSRIKELPGYSNLSASETSDEEDFTATTGETSGEEDFTAAPVCTTTTTATTTTTTTTTSHPTNEIGSGESRESIDTPLSQQDIPESDDDSAEAEKLALSNLGLDIPAGYEISFAGYLSQLKVYFETDCQGTFEAYLLDIALQGFDGRRPLEANAIYLAFIAFYSTHEDNNACLREVKACLEWLNKPDKPEAQQNYLDALKNAAQTRAQAQYLLGVRFLGSQFVERDAITAALWLKKAADSGLPQATKLLDDPTTILSETECALLYVGTDYLKEPHNDSRYAKGLQFLKHEIIAGNNPKILQVQSELADLKESEFPNGIGQALMTYARNTISSHIKAINREFRSGEPLEFSFAMKCFTLAELHGKSGMDYNSEASMAFLKDVVEKSTDVTTRYHAAFHLAYANQSKSPRMSYSYYQIAVALNSKMKGKWDVQLSILKNRLSTTIKNTNSFIGDNKTYLQRGDDCFAEYEQCSVFDVKKKPRLLSQAMEAYWYAYIQENLNGTIGIPDNMKNQQGREYLRGLVKEGDATAARTLASIYMKQNESKKSEEFNLKAHKLGWPTSNLKR